MSSLLEWTETSRKLSSICFCSFKLNSTRGRFWKNTWRWTKATLFSRNVWGWIETSWSSRAVKRSSQTARGERRVLRHSEGGRFFLQRAASTHHNHREDGIHPRACPTRSHSDAELRRTDGRTDSSRASCSGVWWAGWGDRRGWGTWMLWKEKRGNFHSSSHSSALLSVRVSKAQQHADLSSGRQEPSKCWLYWFWIVKLIVISFFSTILDVEAPSS